ncbi:MAG: FecR family protein [Treponema sp.]|jgi:ferric-dicitrate binding protein FerR (iron transport regulator)|nr:FecR family protein [Treponema sp.]
MNTVLKIVFMLMAARISLYAQNTNSAAGSGAVIRDIAGTVEVMLPGAADWIPAKAGMFIANNASISTGFKSTAVLVLGESLVTLRPLTRLTLDELIRGQSNDTAVLSLRTGRIRAEVKPPSDGKTEFTVRTPTATASVRGTVFDLDPMNLNVTEGLVRYAVTGTGAAVSVGEGRSGAVNTESPLGLENPVETIAAAFTPELPQGVRPGLIAGIKTDGGDEGLTVRWGND